MPNQTSPILLFDGGCAVCGHIAQWVQQSARTKSGEVTILVRPVGNDPAELRTLNPGLDIWDAYAKSHLVMPDGSMRIGGEAIAEVLRRLPATKWFAWCFAIGIFGVRPFQLLLNLAYTILDDVRPVLGCGSCGTPAFWVRPITRLVKWAGARFGKSPAPIRPPHFKAFPAASLGSRTARASASKAGAA